MRAVVQRTIRSSVTSRTQAEFYGSGTSGFGEPVI